MRVKIYQSQNLEFAYNSAIRLEKKGISLQRLPGQEYRCVFDGHLWAFSCEDVYRALNERVKPAGYTGHSLSVGDVVEIVENARLELDPAHDAPGLYFCDSIGFKRCAWALKDFK